jgi:chromosome segregation ATPase
VIVCNIINNYIQLLQELQQAKQQLTLNDIRRSLSEVKADAVKRLSDYQKEILNAEKEVTNAEKKLSKTKEQLEKHLNWKEHLESESTSVSGQPLTRLNSGGSVRGIAREHSNRSIERFRESEELTLRYERDIKDDIRGISRALAARDEVLLASRRAFENLDRDCKRAIGSSLKKLISRERETNAARNAVLDKLESTIDKFDVEGDITEFILSSREPDGALILHSQALNILGDLNSSVTSKHTYINIVYQYCVPDHCD